MCGVKTDTIRQACGSVAYLLTRIRAHTEDRGRTDRRECLLQATQSMRAKRGSRAVTHSKC